MISLIALIARNAKSLLPDELSSVDSINALGISPSEIVSATQHLPIYPISSPAVLYFSASCITHDSSPFNSKELNEYQVVQVDDNATPSCIPWNEIDTEEPGGISSADTDMAAEVSKDTSLNIGQTSGFHDNHSLIRKSSPSDPWPQGLLGKDDHITYDDLRSWLNDLNGIYDEEPVFRSILNLPYPSDQSEIFPDPITARPTYGWVSDNFLIDWINDRVVRVSTRAQGALIDDRLVEETDESPDQAGASKAFDLIYTPFIQKLDPQDEEPVREFFQKLYELLAPLRGLLVITILGIARSHGHDASTKGHRLSRLLNQSGIPAANIRVFTSRGHTYVLAKRSDNRDQFESCPEPLTT